MFSTISGNLLLARSKPRGTNYLGFWYSFGTAGSENHWGKPLGASTADYTIVLGKIAKSIPELLDHLLTRTGKMEPVSFRTPGQLFAAQFPSQRYRLQPAPF